MVIAEFSTNNIRSDVKAPFVKADDPGLLFTITRDVAPTTRVTFTYGFRNFDLKTETKVGRK